MNYTKKSTKSRAVDAILCFFLGGFGAHKFYEGKIGMGILYIFTFGLFGIGVLVDFIMILVGSAKDSDGYIIYNWSDTDPDGQVNNPNYSSNRNFSSVTSLDAEDQKIKTLNDYKDLLDKGIITQEEFDKKKSEILGK